MADLDYVKVVGRFGLNVGDAPSGDVDDYPDTKWCTAGQITFTPLSTLIKVLAGTPVPWTGGNSNIVATVDENGYVTYNDKGGVWLLDLASPKVTPRIQNNNATHRVSFVGMKAGNIPVQFESATVRISADRADPITGAVDLTLALPAPSGSTVSTVFGPKGNPGQSVVGLDISSAGHLLVTLSDGITMSTVDAGALPTAGSTNPTNPEPQYSSNSVTGEITVTGAGVRVLSLNGSTNVDLSGPNGSSVALVVHKNGYSLDVEGISIVKDGLFVFYRAEGSWLLATGGGDGESTVPDPVPGGNALPFTLPHTFVADGNQSASNALPFILPHTFVGV